MIYRYQQVCPVIFGRGAVGELSEEIKKEKAERVLLICDKGIATAGHADLVLNILKEQKCTVKLFDGVCAEVPKDLVNELGTKSREWKTDLIIGMGGGSSLDTAKAVSLLLEGENCIEDYYVQNHREVIFTKKLILLPTSSGTGSEVTSVAVIFDEEQGVKETVIRGADLAVVDPDLTMSAPPAVTAASGMDALSHAVESYTSAGHNPKADVLALEAVRLIRHNLKTAYRDGSDFYARTGMSLASNLAGMAFADTNIHWGHAAAHAMEVRFQLPHGVACALTIPEVIRFTADVLPERTIALAEALGCGKKKLMSGKMAGECAAEKIRELMKCVRIPSWKELGIARADVLECAGDAVQKYWFVNNAQKPVDEVVMRNLLDHIYENYR